MAFYFDACEQRTPPPPVAASMGRELLFQYLATVNLAVGGWYIWWRWSASLNHDALWIAVPLAVAETLAYLGLGLFTINLWKTKDAPWRPPPRSIGDCAHDPQDAGQRPLSVDVFFPTYTEDPELVRLSIRDAKRMTYPHPIDVHIHVLDDGRRDAMRQVAAQEGVGYITRASNIGYKAGNLRNGMEHTSGDFLVICDADTRPFPTLLEHTLGYFRDPDVAWVQTPQWFYDLPEGRPLPQWLRRFLGAPGAWIGRAVEACVGPVRIGADPFSNDPQLFYDVLQRRRNWAYASFCCGAGSVHRREAVMEAALREYSRAIHRLVHASTRDIPHPDIRRDLGEAMAYQLAVETELTPYKFHVSEDIYTSIVLHSDRTRRWRSVFHPWVESKMLSPQDLQSWMVQRFKYAAGTLDIALHDNPLFGGGMTLGQRLLYASTFWAYFGCLWNVVFLIAPLIFLFTGIAPIAAYSAEFYARIVPFLVLTELSTMVATWGIRGWDGKASYMSFFATNLRALWVVLRGQRIAFPVTPKERGGGTYFHLVRPQLVVIALTLLGIAWAALRVHAGREPNLSGVLVNSLWGVNNVLLLSGIVRAAAWHPDD